MDVDSCYLLGQIIRVYGIRGEVVAYLDVDFPENYTKMESVFVDTKQGLVPFFIESIRIRNNRATIKFEGINTIEEAEKVKKQKLYLPLDQLPELDGNRFYYHDIIGYSVRDKKLGNIGKVINVYESGAQELIVIEYRGKEILCPIQDDLIREVNKKDRIILVDLPEGLVDIFL